MSLQGLLDFMNGGIAGISFVLCGQPFDTVKVRMQMKQQVIPFHQAALEIYKLEGLRAYYKGMLAPIVANIPSNAILFSSYEYLMRQFNTNQGRHEVLIKEWLLAGGISGVAYALCVCPFEMMKCVMQMQFEYLPKQFKSPLQGLILFYKQEGFRGLFKGQVATIIRDVPQNAVFFATYEYGRHLFITTQQKNEINLLETIVVGALAGLTSCLASYPIDIVKTKLQCEIKVSRSDRLYKAKWFDGGFLACARSIYQQNGWKGFWFGFQSCAVYYVIGSTGEFTAYHYAQIFSNNILSQRKH